MSNVNISILRSNLSVKGDFVNVTIPKMQLKLVHQQGQFIKTFTRHSVIYKCCYCFHTLTKTIATLICMMASFYYYDQDPSGCKCKCVCKYHIRGCQHRQRVRVLERDQRFCVLRIRSAHLHVFKSSCQVALRRVLTKNSKWVERLGRAGFQR